MSGTADLSGSLRDLGLAPLLEFLAAGHQSGVVELTGSTPGLVALYEGAITLALSEHGPTLRQVFIGSGLTSPDDWWQASGEGHRSGSLVDSVIERGADPDDVRRVLYEQAVGALFELLLPSDDEFSFVVGATHPLGTRFRWPVADVLAEAGQRVRAWKTIATSIPSTSLVMRPVRRLPTETVTLSASDWSVLTVLDGQRSIADILRELGSNAFAVCSTLHHLRGVGLVEPVED